MSERDELAADIRGLGITVIDGPPVDLSEPLAQHLHNLGYRKPRTITTTEELDALPYNTIVFHDEGFRISVAQKHAEDLRWYVPGCLEYIRADALLPATVLPEVTA